MEELTNLDKQELVDRLVKYTREFANAYLLGRPPDELAKLRDCIEQLQKEIMARPGSKIDRE